MRLSSLREDQILRISDEGNDDTRAWLQRNVAEIDECNARIADLEAALDVAEAIMTAVAMSPRLCREMIVDDAKLGDALSTTRLLLQKRQPE